MKTKDTTKSAQPQVRRQTRKVVGRSYEPEIEITEAEFIAECERRAETLKQVEEFGDVLFA